jgi:hypothetical protein
MVKGASYNRSARFRIMALTDQMPTISAYSNDVGYECVCRAAQEPRRARRYRDGDQRLGQLAQRAARSVRQPDRLPHHRPSGRDGGQPVRWRSSTSTYRSRTWAGSRTPTWSSAT